MDTQAEKRKKLLPLVQKIRAFIEKEGSGPTYQEIATMMGKKSRSQGYYMAKELEVQGFIERKPQYARSIRLKDMESF